MHMYNDWKNRCFFYTNVLVVMFNRCSKKLERMSTSDLWNFFFHLVINRPIHMCISTLIYEP